MTSPVARFDRIVVGGGAMGLATAWQLAVRGQRVLLLEQFEAGHHRGASHGATRNLNNAYAEPHYLDLYDEALTLWHELEAASGERLLTICGLVSHGDPDRIEASYESLLARGRSAELLSPGRATERWAGMRFEGSVMLSHEAGRIHAATTLTVLDRLARESGAELRYRHRALAVETVGERARVTAQAPDGSQLGFEADGAVITAGAWTRPLLDGLMELPPLRVTEEHPAHFDVRPEFAGAAWPSFNHFLPAGPAGEGRGNVYGMLTPGEGVKVGFHAVGDEVDPDARGFRASDAARARLREYVAEWFPGLDPDSATEISCTYTSTPSERFVLDTRGPITVGAGFSGQGFKFVPAIGRVLADATLDERAPAAAWRLESH